MKLIYSQPYVRVIRRIDNNQQLYIQTLAYIHLYKDRIETEAQTFSLKNVFDMSFKSFSSNNGFLYLHTHQGVFTYIVESNPSKFIKVFKNIKY
ncbi:MAG TPA: hypothetical protein GXX18_07250 [Bacillales bacterium]|nr:hypothetical protein [Bacillales bacterium]